MDFFFGSYRNDEHLKWPYYGYFSLQIFYRSNVTDVPRVFGKEISTVVDLLHCFTNLTDWLIDWLIDQTRLLVKGFLDRLIDWLIDWLILLCAVGLLFQRFRIEASMRVITKYFPFSVTFIFDMLLITAHPDFKMTAKCPSARCAKRPFPSNVENCRTNAWANTLIRTANRTRRWVIARCLRTPAQPRAARRRRWCGSSARAAVSHSASGTVSPTIINAKDLGLPWVKLGMSYMLHAVCRIRSWLTSSTLVNVFSFCLDLSFACTVDWLIGRMYVERSMDWLIDWWVGFVHFCQLIDWLIDWSVVMIVLLRIIVSFFLLQSRSTSKATQQCVIN